MQLTILERISILDGVEASALSGRVHEVYTIACGTYVCWAIARGLALTMSWLPRGRRAILDRVKYWAIIGAKAYVSSILLIGVIPLLFGLLLELVVVVPLRVPLEQNPILFIWQDWALGMLLRLSLFLSNCCIQNVIRIEILY